MAPGATHKGHVWVYVADDDSVLFRYTRRRKSDGPREFLKGYTGYVQADAANLYDRLFGDAEGVSEEAAAKEVGCWAHARRRFFDAQLTDRDRALVGLGFIKKRYEADRLVMKLPPSRRTAERQRLCTPVLDGFKAWLEAEALVVLPKAPIADAIGYTRNQWDALTRFLDDARLKLDNNIAERQLHPSRWAERIGFSQEATTAPSAPVSSTPCSPPASCTGSTPSSTCATSSCASAVTLPATSSTSVPKHGSKS